MKSILIFSLMVVTALTVSASDMTGAPDDCHDCHKAGTLMQLDRTMDSVKAGLIKDLDIKNLCYAIASGGAHGTVRKNLNQIQEKYKFSDQEMLTNVIEGSFCKIDGVVRSIAGAALFSEISDFEVIHEKYKFSKHNKIDIGLGLEDPISMLKREIRNSTLPSQTRAVMKGVFRLLIKP